MLNGKLKLQAVQKEREEKLAESLKNRLHIYVQGNRDEFIQHAEAEVSKLSNAGFSRYESSLLSLNAKYGFPFNPMPSMFLVGVWY
jgi:hypothetical protein